MTQATPISRRHVLGGAAGLTAAALASAPLRLAARPSPFPPTAALTRASRCARTW